jgi:hypothetical protein
LGEGRISFGGVPSLNEGEQKLTVVTAWRQEGDPQPVKIFIHLLDEAGALVAQWDGLDAPWEGWRKGDTLLHVHEIDTAGLGPGAYRLVAGLYDPESLQRWQLDSGRDYIELGVVTVPPH